MFLLTNFLHNLTAPEGKYPKGMRSVFAEMMREEGIFALYKGVTPVLLRAFPANAVSILIIRPTEVNDAERHML